MDAIQSRFVIWAVDNFFYGQPDPERAFRTNPANTMPYQALVALEERAVVCIAEWLRDEHDLHPVTVNIRGRPELERHRDALSHPATLQWRRPDRQAFHNENRVWLDLRPAIIWDLQRSINEALQARGQRTYNDDIPITHEMSEMLHLILQLSVNEGFQPHDPGTLLPFLTQAKERYLQTLEAHPDGRPQDELPR
jgi:hypothetical protein